MPIECLISFDHNSQGVYYAGQELSGVVDLSVDVTKRIKGKPTVQYFTYIFITISIHDSLGVWAMQHFVFYIFT